MGGKLNSQIQDSVMQKRLKPGAHLVEAAEKKVHAETLWAAILCLAPTGGCWSSGKMKK